MLRLAKPYIPESAIEQMAQIIRSGNLIQGETVQRFEMMLCKYLDAKHAVLVSNGTAALHLALLALNIKLGDEVIVPALTFPATANAVEIVGAKPIFVDINIEDYCLDTRQVEAAITSKTKAIMVVHEFGQSADMQHLMAIATARNIEIIEDAACAFGTEFDGQKVGTFGCIGCFSFHPRKALTTGEGGLIVTQDGRLASLLRSLRNHGIESQESGVDFHHAGLNYRLTEFQAALGIGQLAEFDELLAYRIKLAAEYDRALSGIKWIRLPGHFANRKMTYQTYHILLPERIDRAKLIQDLKAGGVETNLGAQALHCLTYYRDKYGFRPDDFPNACRAYRSGLALPMGAHIQAEDTHFIANKLKTLMG